MDILFLFGSIQAVFFALLLVSKSGKQLNDKILIIWFLAIGVHLFAIYGAFQQLYIQYKELLYLSPLAESLIYFHGPALFIYTQVLIAKRPVFKLSYWAHFAIFILSVIILTILFLVSDADLDFFMQLYEEAPVYYSISRLLNLIHGPIYIVWVMIILNQHHKQIKHDFSFTEKVNLQWLRNITIGISVIWITVLVNSLLNFSIGGDSLVYTLVAGFVFLLGFLGLKQGNIFSEVSQLPVNTGDESIKYERSKLDPNIAKEFSAKLMNLMNDQKLYLKSRLTADEVARDLQITPHQLSQLLNQYLGKTFFDFVNEYRVKSAELLLKNSKFDHFTVLGIGLEAGFNSKSSFNRIFKKHTGFTPSEYKLERSR